MTEIAFYHCTTTPLPQALAGILEKILKQDKRALVVVPDQARLQFYDDFLWSYREEAFLPHGTKRDGFAIDQPIWLSQDDYPANNATYAIYLEGALTANPQNYERVFHLFDGLNDDQVQLARDAWKNYKEQQFDLVYYRQGPDASWQKNT